MKKFVKRAAVVAAAAGSALAITPPAANAASYYGAIAISFDTGYIGYTYDYPNSAEARSRSVTACGVGDCESVVWFANGCGAVAYARGGYWSWAYGPSRSSAQSGALQRNRGAGAYIVHWNCTTNHS